MPRPRSSVNISLTELTAMLTSRRRELTKLHNKRRELQRDLDRLDRAIARIEGSGARSRARNDMSLIATIAQLLGKAGKPMAVAEIVRGVQATGYRSGSANFRALVNMTLVKEKQFKNVSRGVYALKSPEAGSPSTSSRRKRKRTRRSQPVEAPKAEQPAAA